MRPVLDILDRLYATRMMLERLGRQYGDAPKQWPAAVAQQLRGRHNALARAIQKHVCSLSDDCYPIGDSLQWPIFCTERPSELPGLIYWVCGAHQVWEVFLRSAVIVANDAQGLEARTY